MGVNRTLHQSQTSNLTRSQPLRPTNLLTTSDPLMTYLPRILMTNSKPTTTNRRTRRTGVGRLGERHPGSVGHSRSYAERDR